MCFNDKNEDLRKQIIFSFKLAWEVFIDKISLRIVFEFQSISLMFSYFISLW